MCLPECFYWGGSQGPAGGAGLLIRHWLKTLQSSLSSDEEQQTNLCSFNVWRKQFCERVTSFAASILSMLECAQIHNAQHELCSKACNNKCSLPQDCTKKYHPLCSSLHLSVKLRVLFCLLCACLLHRRALLTPKQQKEMRKIKK